MVHTHFTWHTLGDMASAMKDVVPLLGVAVHFLHRRWKRRRTPETKVQPAPETDSEARERQEAQDGRFIANALLQALELRETTERLEAEQRDALKLADWNAQEQARAVQHAANLRAIADEREADLVALRLEMERERREHQVCREAREALERRDRARRTAKEDGP